MLWSQRQLKLNMFQTKSLSFPANLLLLLKCPARWGLSSSSYLTRNLKHILNPFYSFLSLFSHQDPWILLNIFDILFFISIPITAILFPFFNGKSVFRLILSCLNFFTSLWVVLSASNLELPHPVVLTAASGHSKTANVTSVIKILQWFHIRYRIRLQKPQYDIEILCALAPACISLWPLSLNLKT